MKKVLFATTALVASAGFAAADIALTGSANMGIKYDGTDTSVNNEIDFNIVATGETDNGLSFGASVDIDASSDDTTFSDDADGSGIDPEVFITTGGLTLTVGANDAGNDIGGLSDMGYDGIGFDDVAEIVTLGTDNVRVDYSFGDIAIAASMDSGSGNEDWGLGISGSFGDFTAIVGVGSHAGDDEASLTLGYNAGAIAVTAYFGDDETTGQGAGLHVAYTTGDVTVSAGYAENDTEDAFAVGLAYDLGGATLGAGVGEIAGETKADLGISFNF